MEQNRTTEAAMPDFDVVIAGAGFAGVGMLRRLRDEGYSVRVFEGAPEVGGVWYWNCYPGACCDSAAEVYSYSFSPELVKEWTWTTRYPTQRAVREYMDYVVDRFDLRRHIQLSSRVESATYDEAGNLWRIEPSNGESVTARYFITAVGCLSEPIRANFVGLDKFKGEQYYTAQWPQDGVDLSGKKVAVIGTGSSGIQIVPVIAPEVSQLTVFQRTANYVLPSNNYDLDPETQQKIKETFNEDRAYAQTTPSGNLFGPIGRNALDDPEEERLRRYEEDWEFGGFRILFGSYDDLAVNREANDTVAKFVRDKMRAVVKDPEKLEKLIPFDHPIGAKRPPLDAGYLEAFNRDNVDLVNLRDEPIDEFVEHGIRTTKQTYEFDVVVYALGFDAMTGALDKIDIGTSSGRKLIRDWENGPATYLGVAVNGYPNFFMMTGPQSPSILGTVPTSIEQDIEWIGDLLNKARVEGIDKIEVTSEAQAEWSRHNQEVADSTLLANANSWYVGANKPGKPRVFFPYIGGVGNYRVHCQEVAEKGYPGFTFVTREPVTAGA